MSDSRHQRRRPRTVTESTRQKDWRRDDPTQCGVQSRKITGKQQQMLSAVKNSINSPIQRPFLLSRRSQSAVQTTIYHITVCCMSRLSTNASGRTGYSN